MTNFKILKLFINKIGLYFVKQRARQLEENAFDPYPYQKEILKKVVNYCGNTELGLRYGLNKIKNTEDARLLPVTNYEILRPDIERIYQVGIKGKGILSWSTIEAFCLTSGTTGGVKYFPITKQSMNMFKQGALSLYAGAFNSLKNPNELFNGKILLLTALPHKYESPTGLNVGYMSGYMHLKSHWLYKDLVYPTVPTALISNPKEKMRSILQEVKEQDIHTIIGFPAVIQLFTEKALVDYGIRHLRQLWPNLKIFCFGGNFLSQSLKDYIRNSWTGSAEDNNDLIFLENYSASEGFFGSTLYPAWPGLVFNSTDIFFQFKLETESKKDSGSFIQLHELEPRKIYSVYITSINGLINYEMGDLIEVTSVKPLTFKFYNRNKEQISVISEKIILKEIHFCVDKLSQKVSRPITDFAVYLLHDSSYRLVFVISLDLSGLIAENEAVQILDNALREKNPLYDDFRNNNIYQMPLVKYQPPAFFNDYRERNIHKGNFKEKRLFMDEAAFNAEYTQTT